MKSAPPTKTAIARLIVQNIEMKSMLLKERRLNMASFDKMQTALKELIVYTLLEKANQEMAETVEQTLRNLGIYASATVDVEIDHIDWEKLEARAQEYSDKEENGEVDKGDNYIELLFDIYKKRSWQKLYKRDTI